jgi:cation/acetate symporter
VSSVGAVMLAYVLFGGMIATTWVQIIKAALLLTASRCSRCWCWRASTSARQLFGAVAARYGQAALEPAGW